MINMRHMNLKRVISKTLEAMNKSTCKTKIGCCLFDSYNYPLSQGFNIENRCHKGYHAEETAVINAILQGIDGSNIKGLMMAGTFDKIYPPCGHCRQIIWEYTKNPNLEIIILNEGDKETHNYKLDDIYPIPYPRDEP